MQCDVDREKRIEQGLQSGSLATREAALLEHDQAQVDRMQSQALKDGTLTDAERARLSAAQNRTSREIATAEHNGVNANPLSASSRRMQADGSSSPAATGRSVRTSSTCAARGGPPGQARP